MSAVLASPAASLNPSRLLGVLGGMSWESTQVYYRALNQGVRERMGGLHSAPVLLHSFDFERVAALQRAGRWDAAAELLANAAHGLACAGAGAVMIATNTMHKVADAVRHAAGVPLLHIGDATGAAVRAAGLRRVGLLGTRFTMEQPFLRDHLLEHHGVELLVPDEADRDLVHRVIFDELCQGIVSDASREAYLGVIDRLAARGAQGVVLGCTEICLLIDPATLTLPAFDSTLLHAEQGLAWLFENS